MQIRYVTDVVKQTNGRTWLDKLLTAGKAPTFNEDTGVVLIDDNMEFIGVFPDRVIADRVAGALLLQQDWNEDHEREISR